MNIIYYTMSEENLLSIVKSMYDEYKNNPVIFKKLSDCIEQLPEG